jgi:hypothetical protein
MAIARKLTQITNFIFMKYPSTPICIFSVGSRRFLGHVRFHMLASQLYSKTIKMFGFVVFGKQCGKGTDSEANNDEHVLLVTCCRILPRSAILDTGLARQSIRTVW